MSVIEEARERGYQLEERPLHGQWVWSGGAATTPDSRAS
jgi:hypothetical protein